MAHTTLIGNLGKDPELKQSQDGSTTYCRLSVAWTERFKDRTGQWVDGPTTWISVTVFGRQAQNVAASLRTGMMIICSGDLKTELWSSDQGEQAKVTMRADIVAPALFSQVVQVAKDDQNQQQPASAPQHGGFRAATGGEGHPDDEPPF